MRDSAFNAHQALVEQAERREAMRRVLLNRPSEARGVSDNAPKRAQREPESRGKNPWPLVLAWCVVYGAALAVLACDLFIWRP